MLAHGLSIGPERNASDGTGVTDKSRASPRRRRGETKGAARKRWRTAGLCQGCGRRKNTKGPLCGKCMADKKK